jgi:hypothetical protein
LYYRNCSELPGEDGRYTGSDIVIADFGISSIMETAEQLHKTTSASRTSGYAAPEVFNRLIGPGVDYYSLGPVLWELSTGKDPFALDNGKHRNAGHLNRDTLQGRMADGILSTKPTLSPSMQKLIRGLMVRDPKKRWGYQQVLDHLAGKDVPLWKQEKKFPPYEIDGKVRTSFDEMGAIILEKPAAVRDFIFRGQLAGILRLNFSDIAERIEAITEESSAKGSEDIGLFKVAFTLSPGLPFPVGNGFSVQSTEDIIFLIANAPETMLPLLRDGNSKLYAYLEVIEKDAQATDTSVVTSNTVEAKLAEIRALAANCSDPELITKAEVILRDRKIRPFKLAKYQYFKLDAPEQLPGVPRDMQNRILQLIADRSYDGLLVPWVDLFLGEKGIQKYEPKTWQEFLSLFGIAS